MWPVAFKRNTQPGHSFEAEPLLVTVRPQLSGLISSRRADRICTATPIWRRRAPLALPRKTYIGTFVLNAHDKGFQR